MVLRTPILMLLRKKLYMSKRSEQLLLADIIQSAQKILDYTTNLTFEEFIDDSRTVDAVVRNFEIIGEAANRLSEKFRDQHTTIDWHIIRSFKNRIVHDYFAIDYSIVWQIKENFLTHLIAQILDIS